MIRLVSAVALASAAMTVTGVANAAVPSAALSVCAAGAGTTAQITGADQSGNNIEGPAFQVPTGGCGAAPVRWAVNRTLKLSYGSKSRTITIPASFAGQTYTVRI